MRPSSPPDSTKKKTFRSIIHFSIPLSREISHCMYAKAAFLSMRTVYRRERAKMKRVNENVCLGDIHHMFSSQERKLRYTTTERKHALTGMVEEVSGQINHFCFMCCFFFCFVLFCLFNVLHCKVQCTNFVVSKRKEILFSDNYAISTTIGATGNSLVCHCITLVWRTAISSGTVTVKPPVAALGHLCSDPSSILLYAFLKSHTFQLPEMSRV